MSEEAKDEQPEIKKQPRRRGPNKPKPLPEEPRGASGIAGVVCIDAVRIGGVQALSLGKSATFEIANYGVGIVVRMSGPAPNCILVPWSNIKQVNYE